MVMPPTVAMDFKSAMEPRMAKQRRMPHWTRAFAFLKVNRGEARTFRKTHSAAGRPFAAPVVPGVARDRGGFLFGDFAADLFPAGRRLRRIGSTAA